MVKCVQFIDRFAQTEDEVIKPLEPFLDGDISLADI